jgi:phage-related minor tail protein
VHDPESLTVALHCDTSQFRREIAEAERLARGFGAGVTRAFAGAVVQGRNLGDVLRSLALQLSSMAIRAALQPLESGLSGILRGLLAPGIDPNGNPIASAARFAAGGVIATPSYFPLGPSLGIAGERGPEAVLPLARGADGKLGVRAERNARPLNVTVNISTPDVASFRRSDAYLYGAIARAVARGERSL